MQGVMETTEAVILRVIPYGDHDRIMIAFSREKGLIKLFAKGATRPKSPYHGICSPLHRAEFVYQWRQSEIHGLKEGRLRDAYTGLRNDLACLAAACAMVQALSSSQMLWKPAPRLYDLLTFYLERLPQIPDPRVLSDSFYLKLLMHEGLLQPTQHCHQCGTPLQGDAAALDGIWSCEQHRSPGAGHLLFSSEDLSYIQVIQNSRSFSTLCDCRSVDYLSLKLSAFFKMTIKQ